MKDNDIDVTVRVVDFAKMPGARSRDDGDNSAQEFFEDILVPETDGFFRGSSKNKILLDLDDTYGYASSFVSELAKLIKQSYGSLKGTRKKLVIKSDQDPGQVEKFWNEYKKSYPDKK